MRKYQPDAPKNGPRERTRGLDYYREKIFQKTIEIYPQPRMRSAAMVEHKESEEKSAVKMDLPELFFNAKEPLNSEFAYDCLKRILRENILPDLRFHDLRHIFASYATASGVDAKTLSGIFGHAKANFTLDVNTHVTPDMMNYASDVVENFMTDILGKELKPWE